MILSKKTMEAVGDFIFDAACKLGGMSMLFGAFLGLALTVGFVKGIASGQWIEFWFFVKPALICLVVFIISLLFTMLDFSPKEKAKKSGKKATHNS